ncbi:MAG: mechanosensitive ion channel protein MscS [Leptolyngbya sp. DLM2.Bin15]|nr:MAG: mechanosensitive ion channel protein MscS [Leptolyngbya sp. DLM2.Bin15]
MLGLVSLGVSLVLGMSSGAIAQLDAPPESKPIVLDGRVLFQVNSSGGFSAAYRAQTINRKLEVAISLNSYPEIEVGERTKTPTIMLNEQHLMTVTGADVPPGRSAHEQALEWRATLETALDQARSERSLSYLRWAALLSVIILGFTAAIQWGLQYCWRRYAQPALLSQFLPDPEDRDDDEADQSKPEDNSPPPPNRLLDALLSLPPLTARLGLWTASLLSITRLFPWTRQWSYVVSQSLLSAFTSPAIDLGRNDYSIFDMLLLLTSVTVLFILSKTVTDLFRARVLVVTGVNRGAQATIAIIVRYSLVFFGSLALMQIWGIDISSLAILASSLGIGIGFGLQDIAKNFGSGLVLVFERPIQVGDFVEVGAFQGTIEHIGARSTLIRTLDQVSIIVPNSRFLENEVINWSLGNPVSRIRVPVGVAYGSDIEIVRDVFLQAARSHPVVLTTPPPQVFFKGFGESSLNFEVMVWTAEPSQQIRLKSDLYFAIEALLREHQVEIPFPQRDLHVRSGQLPITLTPQMEQWIQQLVTAPSSNGHAHHPESDRPSEPLT